MKILIDQNKLAEALSITVRTSSSSNIIQSLAGALLEAKDGKLTVSSQNIETASKVVISDVEVINEGRTLVNAQYLTNFVSKLDNIQLILEVVDNKLVIKYGRSRGVVNILSEEGWVDPINLDEFSELFTVPAFTLQKALQNTIFACAKTHFRQVFTGVLFDIEEESINFVGTNTHKLAIYNVDTFEVPPTEKKQLIVPLKNVTELLKVLSKIKTSVQVMISKNTICFKSEEVVFTSQLLDGNFPNYRAVVPNSDHSIIVETGILQGTLERVNLFPQKTVPVVQLTLQTEDLKVYSASEESNQISEILPLKKGSEVEEKISFNAQYLYEVTKFTGEDLHLGFTGGSAPVLITGEDKSAKYILVPLRAS